jgi:ubiquinol-cytochrome c reductase cytochrome c1 subunit
MFNKLTLSALTALSLLAAPALAAGSSEQQITDFAFSFEGPFGTYDRNQLQRGLQVYTEVCSACHGLNQVAFRSLSDEHGTELPDNQMRAYAAGFEVVDAATGDFRAAGGPDHFPESSYPGAPDLSLMAKARVGFHGPYGLGINQLLRGIGGPEYIASFLTGFTGHEEEQGGNLFYENSAYGGLVSMPPVLFDGIVEYADETEATEAQMAQDVSAFLMWAAEPKMTARKQVGFIGVILLVVLASLLYLTNKRLWAPIKRAAKDA